MKLGLIIEEKDSYRTQLKILLSEPNSSRSFFGKEVLVDRKQNAFTFTTRNSNPKTYSVDVEEWQSDVGIRVIAKEDGYIVCACMIRDNTVTGIITDFGYENIGIGTNLLKYVKNKYPSIKFDDLRSTQGKKLIQRVGEGRLLLKSILNEILSDGIVYHGTNNKFTSFDDSKPIFFSDNINVAKSYGDVIVKAKLNLENPLEIDVDGGSTITFMGKYYLPSQFAKYIKELSGDIKKYGRLEDDMMEDLEQYGWYDHYGDMDGIIMKNIRDSYGDMFAGDIVANNYVVFDKSRISII